MIITYCSGLKNCGSYADDGNNENASSVVVVRVERPKNKTGKLEDVKWVKGLTSSVYKQTNTCDAYVPHRLGVLIATVVEYQWRFYQKSAHGYHDRRH